MGFLLEYLIEQVNMTLFYVNFVCSIKIFYRESQVFGTMDQKYTFEKYGLKFDIEDFF